MSASLDKAKQFQRNGMRTAAQVAGGPYLDPLKRLIVYSSNEWEEFVDEWVSHCLKPKYVSVVPMKGANDHGIDIAAFADEKLLNGLWDNYQCKHYKDPIIPTEAWVEIGKCLWYSYSGIFQPPRSYYFVAPRGAGTTLSLLLSNTQRLKAGLEKAWDKHCKTEITKRHEIPLDGKFASYVQAFDFSIFKTVPVRTLIEEHRSSPYFISRFGGGLPQRPKAEAPPAEIDAIESEYVKRLLEAYGDHTKETIDDVAGLKKWARLGDHFHRQREAFYHAESLRVFVREKVELGTFESLQNEIFRGVVDVCEGVHKDGFQRVVEVTKSALNLPLDSHPLSASTFNLDKHGICHQLANDGRLTWLK